MRGGRMFKLAAASLLIGACCSVAVAYAAALWGRPEFGSQFMRDKEWPVPVPSTWPQRCRGGSVSSGLGVTRYSIVGAHPQPWHDAETGRLTHDEPVVGFFGRTIGWPIRCMYLSDPELWEYDIITTRYYVEPRPLEADGWAVPSFLGMNRQSGWDGPRVPNHALWTGMTANTLIYGLPWFAILWAVPAARTRRRRAKLKCVACGYFIKDLRKCPECGEPVRSAAGPKV